MTITSILTIIIAIASIVLGFILGRVSIKKDKKNKKAKKAKKNKKTKKAVKAKKERKPRKTKQIKADEAQVALLEDAYNRATQNNELVPVTNTVKA